MALMELLMAYYGGFYGVRMGLTKSTDRPGMSGVCR